MEYMFYDCTSLKSLDLKNWDTSLVETIESMFYDCSSLTYIDLSFLDTSSINNMNNLFFNCIQLTSINLDNFSTSSVIDMQCMFYGCSSLLSLNLSSFDTSLVNNMKSMFFGCSKLTSLDLSNFIFENVLNMGFMFSGCTNLEYINLYNYNDDFNANIKGIFLESYDYLILFINNNSNTDNIIHELNFFQCIIYNSFFYLEKNNQKIINDSRKCVINCTINEIYKFEYDNFCYKECPIGTSLLNNEKCEKKNVECFDNFPFLNLKDNTCVDSCNSEDFFKKKCSLNNNKKEVKENLTLNIIKEIEEGLMNEILSEVIKEKNDLIIKEKDLVFQITTSFNQNNKEYQNISTIKLGEFENQIKEKYNISQNESLIIFKVEQFLEGMLIPTIQYEIFHPFTKEKLDLNFDNNKEKIIYIYTSVNINESEEYKYNLKSSYYNDICESFPINDIDLTLYERKNEYFQNNMS